MQVEHMDGPLPPPDGKRKVDESTNDENETNDEVDNPIGELA